MKYARYCHKPDNMEARSPPPRPGIAGLLSVGPRNKVPRRGIAVVPVLISLLQGLGEQ